MYHDAQIHERKAQKVNVFFIQNILFATPWSLLPLAATPLASLVLCPWLAYIYVLLCVL
jgi:hypothetical protein